MFSFKISRTALIFIWILYILIFMFATYRLMRNQKIRYMFLRTTCRLMHSIIWKTSWARCFNFIFCLVMEDGCLLSCDFYSFVTLFCNFFGSSKVEHIWDSGRNNSEKCLYFGCHVKKNILQAAYRTFKTIYMLHNYIKCCK